MKRVFIVFLLVLDLFSFPQLNARSDIPIGTWRTHFSYQSARHVAVASEKIYCATENGLFYYNLADNSLNTLTTMDGLSDTGITSLIFDDKSNILLIGYRNGNIDLLIENRIINIQEIERSNFEDKEIQDAFFLNDRVYLATGFGLVVIDLNLFEILEVYREIGTNGAPVRANQVEMLNDSLFLATDQGLLTAALDPGINLLDFRNWKMKTIPSGTGQGQVEALEVHAGRLILVQDGQIFSYNVGTFNFLNSHSGSVNKLKSTGTDLFLIAESAVYQIDLAGNLDTFPINRLKMPRDLGVDNNGNLWIADSYYGLSRISGADQEFYIPNGPFSDQVGSISNVGDRILVIPSETETSEVKADSTGFYVFTDGQWENFYPGNHPNAVEIPQVYNLTDVAYLAENEQLYFTSYGDGLLVWDLKDDVFSIIDQESPGVSFSGSELLFTSASGGSAGLWVARDKVSRALHHLQNATWTGYNLVYNRPQAVIADEDQNLWMIQPNGASVFNPDTNEEKIIASQAGIGGLPGNRVNDLEIDLQGDVWFATNQGIGFFPGAYAIFGASGYDLIIPVFESTFLFQNENINAIEIDGGNRKWIGTNQGLWLFDENFETLIHHFTTANSPLPSNSILELGMNQSDGELFISTDQGMVSYRTVSSGGQGEHARVKIFPNPVYNDFNGEVGITGLVQDAIIKIVDAGGRLVFQTRAYGGTASWDVRTFNGERAASGIYMILSSDDTGTETFVGKLAVID